MNARKCVHAQKPYSWQAFAHESSNIGGRGKRETGKNVARRLMKGKELSKNLFEELKQGTAQVNEDGRGTRLHLFFTEAQEVAVVPFLIANLAWTGLEQENKS